VQAPAEIQAQAPFWQEPRQHSLFDEQAAPPGRQTQRPPSQNPLRSQQSESTVQVPPNSPAGRASPQQLPLSPHVFSQQSVSKLHAEPLLAQQ
jgi:hypothetical protein